MVRLPKLLMQVQTRTPCGAYLAVASDDCRDVVLRTSTRVLLFTRSAQSGDGAALQSVDELPYPMVEYSGDARALAALLADSAAA